MTNEPVAWMNEHGEISQEEHWAYSTPLYTHPSKDLTDEEIIAICDEVGVIIADTGLQAIRAILRKAQEK